MIIFRTAQAQYFILIIKLLKVIIVAIYCFTCYINKLQTFFIGHLCSKCVNHQKKLIYIFKAFINDTGIYLTHVIDFIGCKVAILFEQLKCTFVLIDNCYLFLGDLLYAMIISDCIFYLPQLIKVA